MHIHKYHFMVTVEHIMHIKDIFFECDCGNKLTGEKGLAIINAAQQSSAPDGLTPRQKEEGEQMIESAIIKVSS